MIPHIVLLVYIYVISLMIMSLTDLNDVTGSVCKSFKVKMSACVHIYKGSNNAGIIIRITGVIKGHVTNGHVSVFLFIYVH